MFVYLIAGLAGAIWLQIIPYMSKHAKQLARIIAHLPHEM